MKNLMCQLVVMTGGMLALATGLAGCSSPPRGQDNNRVEITDTTPAERNSRLPSTAELTEFSDQVVSQLTADLLSVPELNGEYRVTVVFGDIVNKTSIVPQTDFEAFRSRIRQKLMQSRTVLKNIRFIENRERWLANRNRELGGSGDLLQEGPRGNDRSLNPEYTYFLNGEFYRVARGGETVNYYGMSYNLMKASDSELIWSSAPYETKRALR